MESDKPYNHGTMTESQYLGFIRSALRSKWLRWIPRSKALEAVKRLYSGSNPRQKVEYQCAICKGYGSSKEMEVDHYPCDAGSILSVEDIGQFCKNLFCEVDNLRVLHKSCHKIYTHAQRKGISYEDSQIEKEIILIEQQESLDDILNFLYSYGYSEIQVSNTKKRRACMVEVFTNITKGEHCGT